jgi:Domain of Unknown Function (DUF1080)
MKTKSIRFIALLFISLLAIQNITTAQSKAKNSKKPENKEGEKIMLFNNKDLNNWVFKLKGPAVDPAKVFSIQNGVIHITGNPFGYMRTKDAYSDYKLHVEWRWPSEATNSGVFVHAQLPDSVWLRCVECQLQAGNAGDFVCMNGADMDQHTDKKKSFVTKMSKSSEKPVGEWNKMEVICKANTIEVTVNGVLQNKGTNVNLSQGSVCLQSEGKEIEFRNVYLTKLKE